MHGSAPRKMRHVFSRVPSLGLLLEDHWGVKQSRVYVSLYVTADTTVCEVQPITLKAGDNLVVTYNKTPHM